MALNKRSMLALIKRNIEKSGYHVYVVSGGSDPRFAYTIGLTESPLAAELILAGSIIFSAEEVYRILDVIRRRLLMTLKFDSPIVVEPLGTFSLRKAHPAWTKELLLGATDYYQRSDVVAYQVVPDRAHHTVDTPNLGIAWDSKTEPAWQWLRERVNGRCSPAPVPT
jgi:hypothetical protein